MPRYLLIEFDEDKAADALRAQINAATERGKKFRVVGLYARPSKFCTCIRNRSDYNVNRVDRGAKYGWWVCITCHRPRLGRQDMKNLVNPDEVVNPMIKTGIDFLATLPRELPYQLVPGDLTMWPTIRYDLPMFHEPDAGVDVPSVNSFLVDGRVGVAVN